MCFYFIYIYTKHAYFRKNTLHQIIITLQDAIILRANINKKLLFEIKNVPLQDNLTYQR